MSQSELFYCVYVSRVPQSECDLCGYFDKELESSAGFDNLAVQFGYCPYCKRSAKRYFIPVAESNPLEKVPEDYVHEPLVYTETVMDNYADELLALLRKDLTND